MKIIVAIVCVVIVYAIYNFIYKKYWSKNLNVSLNFSNEFSACGEENELVEVVSNAKFLPISILRVRFFVSKFLDFGDKQNVSVSDKSYKNDIFSVMFYQKITRKIKFKCKRRGYYTIDKLELVSYNLFLKTPLTDTRECSLALTVLPESVSAKKLDLVYNSVYGNIVLNRAKQTDPFEFKGIRNYESFDSIKDINWKASARSEDLMVNVHGYTSSQKVMIILNVLADNDFIDDRVIEKCISVALGLSIRFIKNGVPTGLVTNGADSINGSDISLVCAAGDGHIKTIKRALARVDVKNAKDINDVISKLSLEDDTMYVFVSCASKKELIENVKTLGNDKNRVTFVNVYKKGEDRKRSSDAFVNMFNWELETL